MGEKMMMLVCAFCLAVLAIAGCDNEELQRQEKERLTPKLITEANGCKIYKFIDRSQDVYFSDCSGDIKHTTRRCTGGKIRTCHDEDHLTLNTGGSK
ncbi:hypothetical protein [Neisseria sp. Ec49-e6-T10]|uniref:hypothetical protein n=1 Tax=Neisseria sp. Ec49-e6-T10 TaxID=3140744 RepID=UPI003EBF737B